MANAQQITDLLKVAKDIPILNTGIHDTAQEYSTYPVKEHNRLLSSSGKPVMSGKKKSPFLTIVEMVFKNGDYNHF